MDTKANSSQIISGSDSDIGRRASFLKVFIIVLLIITSLGVIIDYLTHDYINVVIEVLELGLFSISFLLLRKGNYKYASILSISALMFFMFGLAINTKQVSTLNFYRNTGYFIITLMLPVMCRVKRRTLSVCTTICVLIQIVYGFFFLGPKGIESSALISELLTSLLIFSLGVFLLFKETNLCIKTETALQKQQLTSIEQVKRLSVTMESAESTLNSLEQINEQVNAIRDLISQSGTSLKDITNNIGDIDHGADDSVSATKVIGDRIDLLNQLIQNHTVALQESSSAINQMVSSIRTVASLTEQEKSVMTTLSDTSQNGEKQLAFLLSSINQIASSIGNIQSIVAVINNISEQTNLLSMNAAIEAAHAGTSGKGFAVVAEEIRKLADNSSKHSAEINNHLKSVVKHINNAVNNSSVTKESFTLIQEKIKTSNRSFDEIANATAELSAGGQEILKAINEIGDMSLKIKEGGNDISNAQHELKSISDSQRLALEQLNFKSSTIIEKNNRILDAVEPIERIGQEGVKFASCHIKSA